MKVVLLAGGKSTRMAPYSAWTEKSLLPLNGKPIIRIIIDRISHQLVDMHHLDFIVCILAKYGPNFTWEFRDLGTFPSTSQRRKLSVQLPITTLQPRKSFILGLTKLSSFIMQMH